jgi:hypothetical protein
VQVGFEERVGAGKLVGPWVGVLRSSVSEDAGVDAAFETWGTSTGWCPDPVVIDLVSSIKHELNEKHVIIHIFHSESQK